jgi:MATE family multidrug resistance protein
MVGQLGVIITGYADTVMVGHYATSALASASFVNNVFNFMVMLCLGFSYGLTPLVGSLYARKDCDSVGALVKNAVVANGLFAVVLLVIMWVVYMNIEHLGLPENLIPTIKPYYQLFFWSMVPVVVSNVLRQFSDAVNDTKLAMWIFTAGNLLNIAGNYVLIYGKFGAPEMGLNGAGVSTLVSRVLMAVAFVWVLAGSRRYKPYFNGFKRGVLSRKSITKVVKTSFPVSMQLGMETGIFTFASLIVGWLGEIQLAAYQVLVMLGMLGFMIYYAVGAATSIKISNYNGVGNVTGVRNAAHAGYVITLLCAIAASATFIFRRSLAHHGVHGRRDCHRRCRRADCAACAVSVWRRYASGFCQLVARHRRGHAYHAQCLYRLCGHRLAACLCPCYSCRMGIERNIHSVHDSAVHCRNAFHAPFLP